MGMQRHQAIPVFGRQPHVAADFDSTWVKAESLDKLFALAFQDDPDGEDKQREFAEITEQGMNGDIPFSESLRRRMALLRANSMHLSELISYLKTEITPCFQANRRVIEKNAERIWVVSGGFSDFIAPVVADFGIAEDHVLANRFRYDTKGNIIGYDETADLAQDGGKILAVQKLALDGPLIAIGDGGTDCQLREAGVAQQMILFTGNVRREGLIPRSDFEAPCLVPAFDYLHQQGYYLEGYHPAAIVREGTPSHYKERL